MAHVGEELRLVLACLGKLTALVLNFLEKANVLDCDHRLIGERLHQLDLLVGEGTYGSAHQRDNADRISFSQQRNAKDGAKTGSFLAFPESVLWVQQDIGQLNWLMLDHGSPVNASSTRLERKISQKKFPLILRETVGRDFLIGSA